MCYRVARTWHDRPLSAQKKMRRLEEALYYLATMASLDVSTPIIAQMAALAVALLSILSDASSTFICAVAPYIVEPLITNLLEVRRTLVRVQTAMFLRRMIPVNEEDLPALLAFSPSLAVVDDCPFNLRYRNPTIYTLTTFFPGQLNFIRNVLSGGQDVA